MFWLCEKDSTCIENGRMRDELVKVGRPVFFNPGQAGRISATTFLNIFILNIHARQIYNK